MPQRFSSLAVLAAPFAAGLAGYLGADPGAVVATGAVALLYTTDRGQYSARIAEHPDCDPAAIVLASIAGSLSAGAFILTAGVAVGRSFA